MGLTLNSNSLTLESAGGGGSSGLTEAQVDARVEANTDYVHLGTLTADASSELEFTGFESGYNTLKIIFDGLYLNGAVLIMSVYLDGASGSNETYLWTIEAANGGSDTVSGTNSDNGWRLTWNWNPNGEVTGQAIISNADASARTPVMSSVLEAVKVTELCVFILVGSLTHLILVR